MKSHAVVFTLKKANKLLDRLVTLQLDVHQEFCSSEKRHHANCRNAIQAVKMLQTVIKDSKPVLQLLNLY